MLDDWQAWVLDEALAEQSDGKWCATQVGLIVPRQNGKNGILEALELAALFLFGERLIVHSAHKFDTAAEHFLRMRALIEGNDDLADEVRTIYTGNGKEAIILKSGARLKFIARSRGGARGFTGDRIVLDEAYDLDPQVIGAMVPALAARSMLDGSTPQIWYTSSAPHPDSSVLHEVRKRGISADESVRMFFAEWGCAEGVDPRDRAAWYAANPALGRRISEEWIADTELTVMTLDEFLRERLGVVAAADVGSGALDAAGWAACADPSSRRDGPVSVALSVGPSMAWSALAVAGRRADGLGHIEVAKHEPGTSWVVAAAVQITAALGVPLVVDPRSPTVGLVDELRAAGVKLAEAATADYVRACSALQSAVAGRTVRHTGQGPLDVAVAHADIRPVVEAWAWSQRSSAIDITPLIAVTLAYGASLAPGPEPFFVY